jgi:membrane-associated phospholipid phosphatase
MHQLDLSILYFFNRTIASEFLDGVADILTTVTYWYVVYVIAGMFLIYHYKLRGVAIVIAAVLLITTTDSLAHYVLKPLVDRQRPCATPSFSRRGQGVVDGEHIVPWIRLPSGKRFDESFPSQHALNNFAMAAFFVSLFKRNKWIHALWLVALVISLGRLYQGLHYPSDVLGGAAIGISIGFLFAILFKVLERRIRL